MIEELTGFSAIIAGFIVGIISLYISTKYRKLSLSFVFLGAAFLSYGVAESYWYLLDSQGMEPYGTFIDILYFMYYAFAILHVMYTIKALNIKSSIETVMLGIIMVSALTGVYVILSVGEVDSESFVYGGLFVTMSAILAALAMTAIIKIYKTSLIRSWLFIGSAILIASLTDVWYYTQENLTGYEYGEFALMDILWFATDLLMIAGIIIHRRKI